MSKRHILLGGETSKLVKLRKRSRKLREDAKTDKKVVNADAFMISADGKSAVKLVGMDSASVSGGFTAITLNSIQGISDLLSVIGPFQRSVDEGSASLRVFGETIRRAVERIPDEPTVYSLELNDIEAISTTPEGVPTIIAYISEGRYSAISSHSGVTIRPYRSRERNLPDVINLSQFPEPYRVASGQIEPQQYFQLIYEYVIEVMASVAPGVENGRFNSTIAQELEVRSLDVTPARTDVTSFDDYATQYCVLGVNYEVILANGIRITWSMGASQ